jgi:hypothetical protein
MEQDFDTLMETRAILRKGRSREAEIKELKALLERMTQRQKREYENGNGPINEEEDGELKRVRVLRME